MICWTFRRSEKNYRSRAEVQIAFLRNIIEFESLRDIGCDIGPDTAFNESGAGSFQPWRSQDGVISWNESYPAQSQMNPWSYGGNLNGKESACSTTS